MKDMWNKRYANSAFAYGEQPNAFFKELLDTLPAGKLLLPAEGEGRNAVYAAQSGFNVVAVDQSESGKEKALLLAQKNGVSITFTVADLTQFTSDVKFDVIALIYAHFPAEIRKTIHTNLSKMLASNGTLIVEAFHPKQLDGFESGGPKQAEMLYTLELLRTDFPNLKEVYGKELTIKLDEGKYHQGDAAVVRWVATNEV